LNLPFGLVKIASPYIENKAINRVTEKFGAGERGKEKDFFSVDQRQNSLGGGGSDESEQGENVSAQKEGARAPSRHAK